MTWMLDRYTIWNTDTREVEQTGVGVKGKIDAGEGRTVYWGEEVPWETHVFNDDGQPAPREAPRVLSSHEVSRAVNKERQRRIERGRLFDGMLVTGSDTDITNLTNLALGAQLRLAMGDDTTTTMFRDGLNNLYALTPSQLIALWQAASAHVSAIYQASWDLKATEPFPSDFASDAYWPT